MKFKTCSKCHQSFPATTEFFCRRAMVHSGLQPWCKTCEAAYRAAHREERATSNHAYRIARQEEMAARNRAYSAVHREELRAYAHTYYVAHREEVAAYNHENRAHRTKYQRQYLRVNPTLRLSKAISSRMGDSLHGRKAGRSWESLVGYTLADLMKHLESRFQAGMSWETYGRYGWHIDHIQSVASFRFETFDDPAFRQCWALSNLQPLWWHDNLSKSAKESALLATDQHVRRKRN